MIEVALFDLADFEEPAARDSRFEPSPITCGLCGEVAANQWMFDLNHLAGGIWSHRRGAMVCTSLDLRLSHLTAAIRYNGKYSFDERDLTVLALGWTFAPDGTAIAPAGWPTHEEARAAA